MHAIRSTSASTTSAASRAHEFIWAYPCHYPGLLRLPGDSIRASASALLVRDRRMQHHGSESAAPPRRRRCARSCMASRLVVVPDAYLARALERRYPGARVARRAAEYAFDGASMPTRAEAPRVGTPRRASRAETVREGRAHGPRTSGCRSAVHRLSARPTSWCREADIVVSAPWPPPAGIPLDALTALSAGRAVVVLETETTAIIPCLDPQTWQPRGVPPQPHAAAVSVDPRDEEHSLMLALARLGRDAALRSELGRGGPSSGGRRTRASRAPCRRGRRSSRSRLGGPSHVRLREDAWRARRQRVGPRDPGRVRRDRGLPRVGRAVTAGPSRTTKTRRTAVCRNALTAFLLRTRPTNDSRTLSHG